MPRAVRRIWNPSAIRAGMLATRNRSADKTHNLLVQARATLILIHFEHDKMQASDRSVQRICTTLLSLRYLQLCGMAAARQEVKAYRSPVIQPESEPAHLQDACGRPSSEIRGYPAIDNTPQDAESHTPYGCRSLRSMVSLKRS